jgi:UDP-N-acetylmuramoylalanine--D-glutamate ligase
MSMFPAKSFAHKKVAVFGLARSGISCALALQLGGAEVLSWDDAAPSVDKAKAEGLKVHNLHEVDFASLDALVLSPGVPFTHPEPHWTVVKAHAAGIEIISDTEIFCREAQAAGACIIGITGTNGKSTTTALVAHVLKSAGLDVDMGGNIGLAVFNLRTPVRDRIYVLELSSFQIDLMPTFRPNIGILTNITPDHLDRHGTMESYAGVKARMFKKQLATDIAIVGVDDAWTKEIATTVKEPIVRQVSVERKLDRGISVVAAKLYDDGAMTMDLSGMTSLRGKHNWQNAAIAYAAARGLKIQVERIYDAMTTFPGLAHRMQQVGARAGVIFVNDSKATNADAAEKALSSFDNIYWIAGGIAKAGGIEPLTPLFSRVKKAFLIGLAAPEFANVLRGKVEYTVSGTMEQAVSDAAEAANHDSQAVVLLSPACSSFDQYKNFEVRGQAFVEAVAALPGVTMAAGSEG